jgi:hypothetical protein
MGGVQQDAGHEACAGAGHAAGAQAGDDGNAPAYPALCKAHCAGDSQLPAANAGADAPAPSVGWFIVATPAEPAITLACSAGLPGAPRAGAPPGWPPLFLTLQVLRN